MTTPHRLSSALQRDMFELSNQLNGKRLAGFVHQRLTFRQAGRDYRLNDVHGTAVPERLA